jgi:hypothetical protein
MKHTKKRKYTRRAPKMLPAKTAESYIYFETYKEFLKALKPPAGFTVQEPEYENSPYHKGRGRPAKDMTVRIVNPDFHNAVIELTCQREVPTEFTRIRGMKQTKCVVFQGHTKYDFDGTTYSFDRTGVGDSFYSDMEEDVNTQLAAQIERIEKSIEFHKSSVVVPTLGFELSPARYEEAKQNLANGKSFDLMPSGFGVGYSFSSRSGNFSKRADAEIEKFFGVEPLYFETQDCD